MENKMFCNVGELTTFPEDEKYILPDGWECAFVNNDPTELSDEEYEALQKWEQNVNPGYCFCVSEDSEFHTHHDAWGVYPYACNCREMYFRREVSLQKFIGKRVVYKDEKISNHVMIVKGLKRDLNGDIGLNVTFEHVGLFDHIINPDKVKIYERGHTPKITMTIAIEGVKNNKTIILESIKSAPEEMLKWKEENDLKNRDLKKQHGEIRSDGKLIGQCMLNGKLKMLSTLF